MLTEFFAGNKNADIQGKVYKKEYKNNKYRVYIKNILFENEPKHFLDYSLILYCDEDILDIGSAIILNGDIILPKTAENDGEFNYRNYLLGQGVYAIVNPVKIYAVNPPRYGILEGLHDYRCSVREFYSENLPGEESGILSAIALGDKTELDSDINNIFNIAGISHILAISGLHLSLLGTGLYQILRYAGLGFGVSGIAAGGIVIAYSIFCGNPISIMRAMLMFLILILSYITGRKYDSINALGFTCFILLVKNPMYIINSGFILSVCAVLGISIFARPVVEQYKMLCRERFSCIYKTDRGRGYKANAKELLIQSIIFIISLQMFMYPIIAYFFNQIPAYNLVLNLLTLPFLGILLICGLFSGLLFIKFSLNICYIIIYYYVFISSTLAKMPGAVTVIAKPDIPVIFLYYFILYIFMSAVTKYGLLNIFNKDIKLNNNIIKNKIKCSLKKSNIMDFVKQNNPRGYIKYKKITRCIKGYIFAVFSLSFILSGLLIGNKPVGFRVDMLSVGQGDGICIQSDEDIVFFIDGGSSDRKNLGEYTLIPYFNAMGIDYVDYWFITHLDADHYNGLLQLLEKGYPIGNLCVSAAMEREEIFNDIVRLCEINQTAVHYLKPEDKIGTNTLSIDIIFPEYPSEFAGKNENSLCFILNYKNFQGIFTGDIGVEQEDYILESGKFKELCNDGVELLKVAHHGSKNSSGDDWIKEVNPQLAIISAGENNFYNHPNPETIERLDNYGITHFCTIDYGRLRVTYRRNRVYIEGYR